MLRCMSPLLMLWTAPPPARECHEYDCCLLRCVGRYWHKADNSVASTFVRFWTNNGQRSILIEDGLSAFDRGCVKTLLIAVSAQQKNRTCRIGESFMRQ